MIARLEHFELLGRDGEIVGLTSGEFRLLNVFLQNPKLALSRDRLMDLMNGADWSPLDRTIDNQIARLRRKIERDPSKPVLIKTVRGIGYMFATDVKTS
jgi:DNA-binding response OmpR family regulator